MKKMEKLSKVSAILEIFVNEHKGSVEPRDVKELLAAQARLDELKTKTITADDAITAARLRREESFDRLQRSVTECKKQIEIVAVRDGVKVVVPNVSAWLHQPARIEALAAKYLKAATTAGDDPAVKKAAAQLEKALEEYQTASGDATENVFNTRTFKQAMETELGELGAKLNGIASYVAGHVTPVERAELYNRLVRARASFTRPRKAAADAAATAPTAQPTAQPSAMPAIQPTPVPPSSEHPSISANA